MISIAEKVDNLNKILEEKEPVRAELIKTFQNKVLNDETIEDESLNEILTELAFDLDFYEPNEEWQQEDNSFYGTERLAEVLKSALQKLQVKK